jgi:anhydro-N-acetylmuramic acid kinase
LIFEKKKIQFPINIVNIGGITNITQIIRKNISEFDNLNAFDIGPGNCLIDEWIRKNSDKKFDKNGDIAKSGKVDELILNQAIDNFSKISYRESLDVKDYDISFVKGLSLENGCATLTKFSAYLIAKGIEYINHLNNFFSKKNLVCGGGRKNKFLLENINNFLIDDKIYLEDIDKYGMNGDFIESQCFAYLAIRSYLNLPISFPSTTGCTLPSKGGTLNKNF